MTEQQVIHILRNPHGWSDDDIRTARLEAARIIEKYKDAYQNMRDFAKYNGLDVTTHA